MRHIKARRRFRLILTMLLVICVLLFCETRIEAFAPQIKSFAILKIEETFSGRVKLSIGSLDGGIIHPLVLNDIKIKDSKGASLFSSLDINSIRTNYRIWDLLLKRESSSVLSQVLERDSRVYINFVTKDEKASGFVRLDGDLAKAHLIGYITLSDNNRIDFSGSVKEDKFDIEIRPAKGSLRAEGSISDAGELTVNLKADHLRLFGLDIVCDAVLRNDIVASSDGRYAEGQFEAKNVVLNYNPFLNMLVSYRIVNGKLEIKDMNMQDSFKGRGNILLKNPFNTDFSLTANNVNLNWLFSHLGAPDAANVLSGTMNAKFELKGTLKNLKSVTHLEIRKGNISTLDFDYLTVTFKGDGPILRIEDSRISRASGSFALAGDIDLRKMGKNSLFSSIKLSTDDRAITWDGWDTKKVLDAKEFSMKKKINDDIDVNFKKFVPDDKVDESVRDTDKVQLEYKLHSNSSLKMTVSQDSDFFGFEHKDKF